MKTRDVSHILIRKPLPNGGYITLYKGLCGRPVIWGYRNRIPRFYPNTCKHCIKAQINRYNRRKPDRDRRKTERRSNQQ